jgi:hypothetical protein
VSDAGLCVCGTSFIVRCRRWGEWENLRCCIRSGEAEVDRASRTRLLLRSPGRYVGVLGKAATRKHSVFKLASSSCTLSGLQGDLSLIGVALLLLGLRGLPPLDLGEGLLDLGAITLYLAWQ